MPERVNWDHLLEEESNPYIQQRVDQLNETEAGRFIHQWLADTFSDVGDLEWEQNCENGRYDAGDEVMIYEFKTKHPNVFEYHPPYMRDVKQVEKYLDSEDVDADYGMLVYINRGDISESHEFLVNGGVTRLSSP